MGLDGVVASFSFVNKKLKLLHKHKLVDDINYERLIRRLYLLFIIMNSMLCSSVTRLHIYWYFVW